MTTPAWPTGSFPFIDDPESYRETGPQNNVIRTEMAKGVRKTRRRFTAAPRSVSGETAIMTAAQYAVFQSWFTNTIADGALPFTAIHPITGVNTTWRFSETYELNFIDHDKMRVRCELETVIA